MTTGEGLTGRAASIAERILRRDQSESLTDVSDAYAVLTATRLLFSSEIRYARLFEHIELEGDHCFRKIDVMWRLPTLNAMNFDPAAGSVSRIVVPLIVMRRGQMYSQLRVESRFSCRILSHRSSARLDRMLIDFAWRRLLALMRTDPSADGAKLHELERKAATAITALVNGNSRDARQAASQFEAMVRTALADSRSQSTSVSSTLGNLFGVIHRMARRHIVWIEIGDASPGDVIEYSYSYRIRFAPEYGSVVRSPKPLPKTYAMWKRWVGQEPSKLIIPISRHTLAHSYHMTISAPLGCFLNELSFVDQDARGTSKQRFMRRAAAAGADFNGADEVGGSIGHLYLRDMPEGNGAHPAVRAHVMERPPGATAAVAWLATVAMAFALLLLVRWEAFFDSQPRTTWTPALLAAPGLVATWFSSVLHGDARRRLPIAARVGLGSTIASSLLTIVVAVSSTVNTLSQPVFSQSWFLLAVVAHAVVVIVVWQQRIHFHSAYRGHQRRVSSKYGL